MYNYKVYKYTNNITGKVYIGQTRQSIEKRAMGKGWGYKNTPTFLMLYKNTAGKIFHVKFYKKV